MAFGFFMNMERISLDIAKGHINYMTNDNMEDDVFLDQQKLEINIKNGFIIITQLITFLESFLNTILNNCIKYKDKELLKVSIDEKLNLNVFHNINIFECDGRDGLVNYVYDKELTMIDESRYEE